MSALKFPCRIVPFGLNIIPDANLLFSDSEPSKILKFCTDATSEITPSASFAFVESLKIRLFRCSVILILYLIPLSSSRLSLTKGSR